MVAVTDLLRTLRLTGEQEAGSGRDKLAVPAGVKEKVPARVRCATLAWHTLSATLKDRHEPVTTE
ncbi:MAG: hypothetical protein ACREXU_01455 [Gammaproteobacteria bacterium]